MALPIPGLIITLCSTVVTSMLYNIYFVSISPVFHWKFRADDIEMMWYVLQVFLSCSDAFAMLWSLCLVGEAKTSATTEMVSWVLPESSVVDCNASNGVWWMIGSFFQVERMIFERYRMKKKCGATKLMLINIINSLLRS